jgi:hypothetical protein
LQLEAAKAELRSRPPFEAADLGVLLLRALAGPTLWAWLGFVLPLQLGVLWLCAPSSWAGYVVLWWLKPLYARAYCLVLGRGLFGDPPTLRGLYRALWRDGRRGLLGDLSWRRLDPARTLVAPVSVLEGLTGTAAARRRRTLGEGSSMLVAQLVGACSMIETACAVGLFFGADALLPADAGWIVEDLWSGDKELLFQRTALGSYLLAIALTEPLFVAAGFGLYINRRTNIEGWDVELTFRRMARRLAGGAAALPLLVCSAWLWLAPGHAQDAQQAPMSQSALHEAQRLPAPDVDGAGAAPAAMARVLARPELKRVHTEEHWQLRSQAKPDASPKLSLTWLATLADWLAQSLVMLLWGVGVVAVAVVIALIVQRTRGARARALPEEVVPAFLARLHGEAATSVPLLPHEVVPKALALLAAGQHAAALSVLYVGTLTALMRQDGLDVPRQATEGQCLAVVRAAPIAAERSALFGDLTSAWQLSAYAHVRPEDARLQELCNRYLTCFVSGGP